MAFWKVKMEDEVEAELTKLLKWVFEMEEFGPGYVATSSEWHDHELDREWRGYRSSAFGSSGRVIYKIIDDQIIVQVARVTTDHNYKNSPKRLL